jgi:hypothetical protein
VPRVKHYLPCQPSRWDAAVIGDGGWRERNRRAVQATPATSRFRAGLFGLGVLFCLVLAALAFADSAWALAGICAVVGAACALALYMVVTGLRS